MTADLGNSFWSAHPSMRKEDVIDSVLELCNFPEELPIDYVMLLQRWFSGRISDGGLLDVAALIHMEHFQITFCLIDAYSKGGFI